MVLPNKTGRDNETNAQEASGMAVPAKNTGTPASMGMRDIRDIRSRENAERGVRDMASQAQAQSIGENSPHPR